MCLNVPVLREWTEREKENVAVCLNHSGVERADRLREREREREKL